MTLIELRLFLGYNRFYSQLPTSLPKTLHSSLLSPTIFSVSNRFSSKIASNLLNSWISSSGSFSDCAPTHPSSQISCPKYVLRSCSDRGKLINLPMLKLHYYGGFRSFVASASSVLRPNAFRKQVLDVVEMIRRNENGLESRLNSINVSLSDITLVFRVLNCENVSALRLFDWIRVSRPDFSRNFDICSLVIDNCGRLSDYQTMLGILKSFRPKHICLTKMAFGFLLDSIENKALVIDSVKKVVKTLNEVGGSCRTSGVRSLIEVFSCSDLFEMAEFVMKITERNTSYYNIMIKEKCRKCDIKGARAILDRMREVGCEPDIKGCNLVLSYMCKNGESPEVLLDEMKAMKFTPDELTFEILIVYSCKFGRFEFALDFLDKMVSWGLEPRLTTHAAFIKGYFNLNRFEEAHKYVVDSSLKHKYSSNVTYSLLANLHLKTGNPIAAMNILSELIGIGLRPSFQVFVRVLKSLRKLDRNDLAEELENRLSSLSSQTSGEAG
ncbi:hypothetical protein UlMin_036070 [Ulmus minor]